MAVPTVTAISPEAAHPAGRTLVEIQGTNFNVPVIPVSGQTDGEELKTVEVLFGDQLSPKVSVVDSTRLFAQTPAVTLPNTDQNYSALETSITVRNIDQETGDAIPGEEAVQANAFTFIRPTLTGESENKSDLSRIVAELIVQFRSQLIDEVVVNTDTDWDESGNLSVNVQHIAKLPALVLLGPQLTENRFYTDNEEDEVDDGDEFIRTQVPYVVDIGFDFVGTSNNFNESLNLMSNMIAFFRANKWLYHAIDPDDIDKGFAKYELEVDEDGEPKMSSRASNSNLHPFSGSLMVRGFRIEGFSGLGLGKTQGVPRNEIKHRGTSTDDQGVVFDPFEQTAPVSGNVRGAGLTSNTKPGPTAKADQPLVVRAILSERGLR